MQWLEERSYHTLYKLTRHVHVTSGPFNGDSDSEMRKVLMKNHRKQDGGEPLTSNGHIF